MDFKITQGLKKDSDFRKVYKHGKSFANRNLVMYILDNKSDSTRVGISVSKKVGNAISRNKIKRRLKNIIDKKDYKNNFNCIIIVGKGILFRSFEEMSNNLYFALDKLDLVKEK